MLCPACHHPLAEISAPPVLIDVCISGCKGIWFDRSELEKILKNQAQADQLMNHTGWEVQDQVPGPGRHCPRCAEVRLRPFHWGSQYPVELDLCPSCGGFWLDAGELLLVSEGLKSGEKLPQVQPVARPGISAELADSLTPNQIQAWKLVGDMAEAAVWVGPDLIHAGLVVADGMGEVLSTALDLLPEAGEAVLHAPATLLEGAAAAAEVAVDLAEGVGAVAEGIGAVIGAIFEFLGSLN